MKKERISSAVIRRLPRYFRHLMDLEARGTVRISSGALAESMGLTASQIRQDLSCFGEFGQQGYGYNVESLRREIGDILGINRGHRAILMGLGNLGRALVDNFRFRLNGFKLDAIFEIDPNIISRGVEDIMVLHPDDLERYIQTHQVDVAVLTVPASIAQGVTDRLVKCGVRGIWNFTNVELTVPENVIVENVHFADSLLTLSYLISEE